MVGLSTPLRPMIFFDGILGFDRHWLWRRVARMCAAVRARVCVRAPGARACVCARVLLFRFCSPMIGADAFTRRVAQQHHMKKLSRKEIREGFNTIPMESILGKGVSKELTAKQKAFAREVASGATKADAYRKAYKADASPHTLVSKPYHLMRDDRIRAEVQAYEAAIEAARYRTPAALRELVIQSLVSVVINPETKDSVKVAAAKVLGTVTEVAAFTERKEVRTISSSEDARTKIMGELKRLINDSATDATIIETQADELLRELGGDSPDTLPESDSGLIDTHPPGTPPNVSDAPLPHTHTIPPQRSSSSPISEPDEPTPPPVSGDTPPSSLE